MGADWRAFCQGKQVQLDGDEVTVEFENGRSHRVRVRETDDTLEMHALVAKKQAVQSIPDLPLRIWRHNRSSQLVGFRQGVRGHICAEGWVAKAGLTKDEFLFVLRRVAAEGDRFEFILTGRDTE